ncbi:LOW QUALITY PROTEIN: neural proliferation differentiation and control protein 1 [Neophocaena asiaeorientalis asiaeorientalis]|uniref:LOW QUALITY PROTEIN: neural proliferation differentiation and control protein 1 n=1 Tax=Neophocaena asiaeorientalis asiaeorientalis TaxID=1706337 RepID=A0A341CWN5_NEOAA|nr:LOW QUALITY PROTEIN: neural proliferation differentiation and control protein 1 [Neophocaena asiaeorientalis asiaeorientalis]
MAWPVVPGLPQSLAVVAAGVTPAWFVFPKQVRLADSVASIPSPSGSAVPWGQARDAAVCPGSLDCALKRRARCPPGAHICGPCLQPFQEDQQGLCVPRLRQPQGEGLPQPRLEDEIDFLAQELARQEAGHSRLTAPPQPEGRLRLLEAASTLGLSERGRGPNLGLPSTRGAPTPRTTSLRSTVSSGPVHMSPLEPRGGRGDGLALLLIVACSVAGAAALAVAVLCWCRLQRDVRLTQKADYAAPQAPSSPATPRISWPSHPYPGPAAPAPIPGHWHLEGREDPTILPPPRHKEPPKALDSASSDEENEDGDFTVYECPGLAPTGEMEVRNPLFDHASLSAPPLQ